MKGELKLNCKLKWWIASLNSEMWALTLTAMGSKIPIWVGHRLLFFCPLIHYLDAWFFNCNEKTWPRYPENYVSNFEGINCQTDCRNCILWASKSNYGMSFVPGIVQAQICLNFCNFRTERTENMVSSASLKKSILLFFSIIVILLSSYC